MRNGKRGRYTLEFKQEAARLVESGQSQAAAARSLGVVEQTLGNWVKEKMEEEELAQSVKTIRSHLERFCEVMDRDRTCIELVSNILVRVGHPDEEILGAAREECSDILVLGTHGKGFLKNAILGRVSRKVLDRSPRPVVVVPLPDDKVSWEAAL